MSYIILKGRWGDIIVTNVHAPTEDKTDDIKDRFYEELEHVSDKFPKYPMNILLGDFNAKVGREDISKPTTRNESLHEISNDNGVRVVNFDTSKNLNVKGTMFPHLNIRKFTWTSPDEKIHNQIDHILIDMGRHSSIPDVRLFRAADCDTDHYLVVAKVRERLAVSKQTTHRVHMERFNFKKLNEVEGKESRSRFTALENFDTEVDVNTAWEAIRDNIKISDKESLGYYELKKHKPWFDEGCSKLLDQRKQAKLQWLQDPTEIHRDNLNNIKRETSRHFRYKKREYVKDKIDALAMNSKNKNIRDLYRGTNDFKRGYQPSSNLVKDENGDLLADSHNILNRWRNYFSQLLNVHRVSAVRQTEMHTAEPLVPEPTHFEVESAIAKLKRYKSPGSDQIPAELIQAGGEILRSKIHNLITSIWHKEKLPDQWKESLIVPVYKKGDKTNSSNYRVVSLLSTSYKILSNILLSRLSPDRLTDRQSQCDLDLEVTVTQMKLLGIINVGFDAKDQPLIRLFAFVRYWRKNGSTMR
ncbi:hypothetical protein B7P43_G04553 [Cryptotermes secundus]|uniref:Endonuclease/exonuclease/phosphatase domain-containing protein n=1 Tax=Cryptotermes secundus TaxID=105785 RepID=A0A2J7QLN1_9NEOP|nr:hypothetical protein B7P43_G04553 [Cryptotermes secundus]